jgi:uncharacterized protein YdeI (BOF family)
MLKNWGSMVAAAAIFASSTVTAAESGAQQQGALAPGKAAGVEQAQGMSDNTTMLLVGSIIVAGGLCLVLCDTGNGTPATTTTSAPP